jgi:phenylacetate-CoA ligase
MTATAASIRRTPLENWIAMRLAVSEAKLTREAIADYQLQAIKNTVAMARARSSFYARRLSTLPSDAPRSLGEVSQLPFTTAEDLAQHAPEFLCVSQDEISRVVTLHSSGTTGAPKRLFFTADDQELALDFFAKGVAAIAAPGERMLIALPGEREGSVGYQLAKGIARAGVVAIPHGLSMDPEETLAHMEREEATCIIGLPVQMLALAWSEKGGANGFRRLRSIVLCSDHVAESLARTLRQRSGAEIFEHYGMTEMGLGGGVDCEAHMGYHLREADLYFEIVDPETGELLPDGETGEIAFTTLNRTGMPLIRYRTGDLSRFLPGRCACGTMLKRLERIRNRIDGSIGLGQCGFNIGMLDEALFTIHGLLDFSAAIYETVPRRLQLMVYAPGLAADRLEPTVRNAIRTIPGLHQSCSAGELQLEVIHMTEPFPVTGAKRRIEAGAGQ